MSPFSMSGISSSRASAGSIAWYAKAATLRIHRFRMNHREVERPAVVTPGLRVALFVILTGTRGKQWGLSKRLSPRCEDLSLG